MNKRPSVPAPGETTVLSDKVVPSRGSAKHHLLQQALPDHTTIPLATGFIYLSVSQDSGCIPLRMALCNLALPS